MSNGIKHKMTGKINDEAENMKNSGEMQIIWLVLYRFGRVLQSDSNLYFFVCTMSKATSIKDQSAVKNGMALTITARNRWKCSFALYTWAMR